jgi:hypothetical protein
VCVCVCVCRSYCDNVLLVATEKVYDLLLSQELPQGYISRTRRMVMWRETELATSPLYLLVDTNVSAVIKITIGICQNIPHLNFKEVVLLDERMHVPWSVYGKCRVYIWVIKHFVESATLNHTDDFYVRMLVVPYFHVCGECRRGLDPLHGHYVSALIHLFLNFM